MIVSWVFVDCVDVDVDVAVLGVGVVLRVVCDICMDVHFPIQLAGLSVLARS